MRRALQSAPPKTVIATGLLVVVNLAVAASSPAGAATRLVSPSGADSGNCSSTACLTMTYALTQANPTGDTISLAPGTYVENVIVDKSVVIAGASQATTKVVPAISDPNCGGAGGGSLCPPNGSNVFLVRANSVEVRNLTIDGDNPGLTSGVVVGGADLDARNGIITDHIPSSGIGTVIGLNVHDVTVKNVYLRGLYASTGNGTFSFVHNTVQNVQANPASICIFGFTSSGTIAFNSVSDCGDAIAVNWSVGTQILNNTITRSGSAVHTDNAGGAYAGSAVNDLIQGNHATNLWPGVSYAFWTFASYTSPTVSNNTVIGATVGLGAFGANGGVPSFLNNTVDCQNQTGSIGAWASTTIFQFGALDLHATMQGNYLAHCEVGLQGDAETASLTTYTLTLDASGNTMLHNTLAGVSIPDPAAYNPPSPANSPGAYDITLDHNRIFGNAVGLSRTTTAASLALTAGENWWGCNSGPGGSGMLGPCDTVVGTLAFTPYLVLAAAVAPGTILAPGSGTVVADLAHDSAFAPAAPGVPDLTPIAFTPHLPGVALTPTNPITLSGLATSTLSASIGASGLVCAAVDNEEQCTGVTVEQAPAITSADQVAFELGVPDTFTVTTTGFPAPAISRTGGLPSGVTFVDNGDGTATLSGTPAYGTGGTYPLTLGASNGVLPDTVQSFTLTVETGEFFTVTPCRVFDSRLSTPFTSGVTRIVQLSSVCGIPTTANAVSVNLTAVTPSGTGILRSFAGDQTTPGTDVLSYNLGVTRANNAAVQLALDGSGSIALLPTFPGGGTVDFVVDVNGYFN